MWTRLGPVPLDLNATGGFDLAEGWSYVEHPVIEGLPVMQAIGPALREIRARFRFHAALGDPEALMDDLARLARTRQAEALLRGDGVYLGHFVITKLGRTSRWTHADGRVIALDGRLILKQSPRPGPRRPLGSARAASAHARRARPAGPGASGDQS